MIVTWQTLIFLGLGLAGMIAAMIYAGRARTLEAALSPELRQKFRDQYVSPSARADMPADLAPLAAAHDRARGARAGAGLLIALALFFILL